MSKQADDLASILEDQLTSRYGPLLSGEALCQSLGFASMEALRQAISRGVVPVPIFGLEHRRGKFALAKDVAHWLASKRNAALGALRGN